MSAGSLFASQVSGGSRRPVEYDPDDFSTHHSLDDKDQAPNKAGREKRSAECS
jgi:hypothetical protein